MEPQVLLLDEPFGALDAKVRKELRRWLRRLHDELHISSIFVTHDQEEALEVADKIVLMNKGRIEQIGAPREIYNEPATSFACSFIGNVNEFRGRIEGNYLRIGDDLPGRGTEWLCMSAKRSEENKLWRTRLLAARFGARRGRGAGGIVRPGMLRILAAHIGLYRGPRPRPEPRQVARNLNRPMGGRKKIQRQR